MRVKAGDLQSVSCTKWIEKRRTSSHALRLRIIRAIFRCSFVIPGCGANLYSHRELPHQRVHPVVIQSVETYGSNPNSSTVAPFGGKTIPASSCLTTFALRPPFMPSTESDLLRLLVDADILLLEGVVKR